MNNFDYQMFLNGNMNDSFGEMFLQNNNSSNFPMFNNNNNMNNNLFTPTEGYTKGNLFKDLYEPFKNYVPAKLTASNEKESLLINLGQMHFAMHELNLYLDNFPNDNNMINKFNEFRGAYQKLLDEYQSKYGPIEITSPYMKNSPFAWSNDKFPWDRRNS